MTISCINFNKGVPVLELNRDAFYGAIEHFINAFATTRPMGAARGKRNVPKEIVRLHITRRLHRWSV